MAPGYMNNGLIGTLRDRINPNWFDKLLFSGRQERDLHDWLGGILFYIPFYLFSCLLFYNFHVEPHLEI